MHRFFLLFALGIVTLCILAALVMNDLPRLSFLFVPRDIEQAVADSLACGDGSCAAITVGVKQTPVDAADQSSGIEARWCVAYVRIEGNTGKYTRNYVRWAYQTAKSYRFTIEKKHGSYEAVSNSRNSDGDPERYNRYCR
jgi:hypothetical protein